jgi:hypothetical protein
MGWNHTDEQRVIAEVGGRATPFDRKTARRYTSVLSKIGCRMELDAALKNR